MGIGHGHVFIIKRKFCQVMRFMLVMAQVEFPIRIPSRGERGQK